MQYYQQEMVPRLCAESRRWVVVSAEAGSYKVRNNDGRRSVHITVSQRPGATCTLFQAFFGIRFSLEREPRGLFARVLLRNFQLKFAAWGMYIGESCEACLYLSTLVPTAGLHAMLFTAICEEILTEMNSLEDELHSKFTYNPGSPPERYQLPR
jgi:hypothetical protein